MIIITMVMIAENKKWNQTKRKWLLYWEEDKLRRGDGGVWEKERQKDRTEKNANTINWNYIKWGVEEEEMIRIQSSDGDSSKTQIKQRDRDTQE